jgi:uncharacterized membrane protein
VPTLSEAPAPGQLPELLQSLLDPKLPNDERAEIVSMALTIVKRHSGPIPSPESFAAYEKVLPGSADRIIGMAERIQQHEIRVREADQTGEIQYRDRGLNYGMIAFLAIMALGGFCVWQKEIVLGGLVLAGGFATGVVQLFIHGAIRLPQAGGDDDADDEEDDKPPPKKPSGKPKPRGGRRR